MHSVDEGCSAPDGSASQESIPPVPPAEQRQGIGGALYRVLLATLREQGFQTAIGKITLPNAASVKLHETFGFVRSGILAKVGFKNGGWHDVGLYQLELDYLVRAEWARSGDDVLWRRTKLGLRLSPEQRDRVQACVARMVPLLVGAAAEGTETPSA